MAKIEMLGGMSHYYLIHGDAGCVLVDTGFAADLDSLLRRLAALPLRLVLLTHGHHDHIANAEHVRRQFDVPIAMHPADRPLIADKKAKPLHAAGVLGRIMMLLSDRMDRGASLPVFEPDIDLRDGMSLEVYGIAADVRALPGHTAGSVGVLVEGRDFLVGDAMAHLAIGAGPTLYEDREAALQSVSRIRASGARTAYVGHGRPVRL